MDDYYDMNPNVADALSGTQITMRYRFYESNSDTTATVSLHGKDCHSLETLLPQIVNFLHKAGFSVNSLTATVCHKDGTQTDFTAC